MNRSSFSETNDYMASFIKLLLAEDDEIFSQLINDVLAPEGYHLTSFRDGVSAWEHLQQHSDYDLVLLDYKMPEMDGMTLLSNIKSDSQLSALPIVMVTAVGDVDSIRRGLDLGAYYYLTKPIQSDVLLSVVNSAVQHNQQVQELVETVRQIQRPLAYMKEGSFQFKSYSEAKRKSKT